MSDWILVPCLVSLRAAFNQLAPGRDKASDGSIGDTAHAASGTSDHLPDEDFAGLRGKDSDSRNEVHAIDVDSSGPWPQMAGKPGSMERIVQHLLARCRANLEDRLRYIIYDHRIWSASSNWAQQVYTGSSPHTEHAHFSATYGSAQEADTHSWHLEDLVDLTAANLAAIAKAVVTADILAAPAGSDPKNPTWSLESFVRNGYNEAKAARVAANAALLAAGADDTDESAIVAGVLAGLDPAAIAAAIPADLAQRVADELAARLQD